MVAFSVGGNAQILADREGFEQALPIPDAAASTEHGKSCSRSAHPRRARVGPPGYACSDNARRGSRRRTAERSAQALPDKRG